MAKWFVKNLKEDIRSISETTKIHPILVRLMLNRKIPEDKMNDFLNPTKFFSRSFFNERYG